MGEGLEEKMKAFFEFVDILGHAIVVFIIFKTFK